MKDPYDILGIPSDSSEDEIKAAYKRAAMKYHPDFSDSGNRSLNEEKMKEIDDAYDLIMNNMKLSGTDSEKFPQWTRSVSEFADVRRLIDRKRYDDAEELLDGIPKDSRNSEWNFLKGFILFKRGWLEEAEVYAEKACEEDPYNEEYKNLMDELDGSDESFFKVYKPKGAGCSSCSLCMSLCCMDLCCGCFLPRGKTGKG